MHMKTTIYCKPTSKGIHSFYVSVGSEEYFLFSQNYRKGVAEYFGNGVIFKDAINYSKGRHDNAIVRTMSKIPKYIKYIENEYDVVILNKTKKKYKNCNAYACA